MSYEIKQTVFRVPYCCGAAVVVNFGPETVSAVPVFIDKRGADWLAKLSANINDFTEDFLTSGWCDGYHVDDGGSGKTPGRILPHRDGRTHLLAYVNDYQMGNVGDLMQEIGWTEISSFTNPKSGSVVHILELVRDVS